MNDSLSVVKNIETQIFECSDCPRGQGRHYKVPGFIGNKTIVDGRAKILFLFEFPEAGEGKVHSPLSGEVGNFINKIFLDNKFDKQNLCALHTVKCATSFVRCPKDFETLICVEWTRKQLEILKPVLMLAFGRMSVDALSYIYNFKKDDVSLSSDSTQRVYSLSKLRENPIICADEGKECIIFSTYSPYFFDSKIRKNQTLISNKIKDDIIRFIKIYKTSFGEA